MSLLPRKGESREHRLAHAAFYALLLRTRGLTRVEAAELVAERYPETRGQLKALLYAAPPAAWEQILKEERTR